MMMNKTILPALIILNIILSTSSYATVPLSTQLKLGVSKIVIDAGQGGHDYGAPCYLEGIYSKDINLTIAKRLAEKIREKLHIEVVLTRDSDKFIPLEERTAIANTKGADLFISIQTNAAKDINAYGIETYYLNLNLGETTLKVNDTSIKNLSDLPIILSDLIQNAQIEESKRLARQVQESLYNHLKKRYSNIKNRGIKQAPFYVLLGTQMPAILVATSFISNPRECKRLISEKYQNDLSDAIVIGIRNYIEELKQ